MHQLWSLTNDRLDVRPHPGQWRALRSHKRIIAILAGTQGGKTSFLPWWLWYEIERCGAGDYLAVTATYDLFKLKFLPALREVFEHVTGDGRYWSGDRVIELRDPTTRQFWAQRADDPMWGRIILRSAESGGGLESSTANAAILDEAGMDEFTLETYEAVRRRLTLKRGRACMGTTLYNLGWLKQTIYDPWVAAKRDHPEIDVIQFASIVNPAFPRAEYDEAATRMQRWRFDMQYRGEYSRPAGQIYDNFDETRHVVPRFTIPSHWRRFIGLDFGGVNTAALFYAEEPETKRLYLYREYHAGSRSSAEHAAELRRGEPQMPFCCGGAKSEGQWRTEFRRAGLPLAEPAISDVEVGIARVYAQHSMDAIMVFDDCTGYLDQKRSYSRVVDDRGEPTEKIADKSTYHYMDAERYIISRIRP